MRELGNARDETELDHRLTRLERLVKLLHNRSHRLEHLVLMQHIEQWRVILINDNHHLPPRLLVEMPNQPLENLTGCDL